MSIEIGGHVDDPIAAAHADGFPIAQTFLGDPQAWKGHAVPHPGGAAGLKADAEAAGVGLFIHAPYVINVATTNNRIRIPSRQILAKQVKLATEVGARGVIVHGGHVNNGDDPQVGFDNWRKAIEGLDLTVPIFIENTAGGANAMARQLERIARLWDTIADAKGIENVGFCLDTCHAHAGGLDPDGLVDAIKGITGRIDLVHLNDSRDAAGSGADRHAVLGAGECEADYLVSVVREAGAPVILETPTADVSHADQIAWLRARL
ncbi:deoxyribonuclease IV [Propioniciclava coleopterorum]|uniref:Deoxyribonuclease IV n=1 Tax=Propioniciclava coleopterorum TaxID=2714937 RepID=A0A6G7Y6Z3_9ACTN|nr:deoxyribonuclease IV [Propioniciclava coleopterorum]QIK72387.1 deoxyribonuclease IV [Propioniciclava coleopterorum]